MANAIEDISLLTERVKNERKRRKPASGTASRNPDNHSRTSSGTDSGSPGPVSESPNLPLSGGNGSDSTTGNRGENESNSVNVGGENAIGIGEQSIADSRDADSVFGSTAGTSDIASDGDNGAIDGDERTDGSDNGNRGTGGESTGFSETLEFGGITKAETGRNPKPHLVDIPSSALKAEAEAEKPKRGRPKGASRSSNSSVSEELIEAGLETVFGALTFLRGPHWQIDPSADLSVVSKPAKRMVDRMPAASREKFEKYADPAMVLFGILILSQPALAVEMEIARNGIRRPSPGSQPLPQPPQPPQPQYQPPIVSEQPPQPYSGRNGAIGQTDGAFGSLNRVR